MRGIYHAAGSMLVNQFHLENISHNLANLHTPGYKRSEPVQKTFPEILLYRRERMGSGEGKAGLQPIGPAALNVALEETPLIYLNGALLQTGEQLDLALQGEGFFVLETPGGVGYSRDGRFHLNAAGVLVNTAGYPVLGEDGLLTLQTGAVVVDGAGNVYAGGERVNRLRLLAFDPENLLWKEGYNLFQAAEGAVSRRAEAEVWQGYLEESNADLLRQMTALLKVRRSYEAAQKTSQTYDRLLSRAANELGSLG
ncbi:MAG: flagellar hook-basal body protein [Dethiobacteria bacterium]|jgi:flagellar basal-body rod protein FlgF